MTGRLQNRVALVMGAGSSGPGWGNGKASALTFARAGAHVVAVDRDPAAAAETADLIAAEGLSGDAAACDATDGAAVAALVDDAIGAHGRIDVLMNNIGIAVMGGPVELSEEEWRRVLDINLTTIFSACKHVLPHMTQAGRGAIVNTSSIAGIRYVGYPYDSYYATQGAINQLTVGLALQYAKQGVRVNAIMPGLMDTPMIYGQISTEYADLDEMVAARHAMCPTGRMGTAWDVANAALFLASDEAGYITGHCLPVDGGLTMTVA
ncbi:MAG: SDR family NAD(P)-dependent oxidoreductase [Pseudomonadota bacterium]|nr:SDR family NAD(P)-dependent oxidoreductase [Pseudomonadota bacterium]